MTSFLAALAVLTLLSIGLRASQRAAAPVRIRR